MIYSCETCEIPHNNFNLIEHMKILNGILWKESINTNLIYEIGNLIYNLNDISK